MKILHLSDIHYRSTYTASATPYERMLADMTHPEAWLRACLAQVFSETLVDLIVISGDLTEDGSAEEYRALRRLIESYSGDTPIVVTPGNHDSKRALREGWFDEAASDAPYCAVHDAGEFVLLSFDSSVQGCGRGSITAAVLQWLAETLEAHRERPVLLLTHHHFDACQASIPPLENEALWMLLARYPLLGILNGHTHHHAEGICHDIPYHTADGLSFCGDNLSDGRVRFSERVGYSLYEIENGVFTRTTIETLRNGRVIAMIEGSDL